MTPKEHASPIRRFFSSRLFLICILFAVGVVALGYARAYYQDYKIAQEIRSLEKEVSQLENKKLESLDILTYVMSDTFVEESARTQLNVKKPGEHVVVVESSVSSAVARGQLHPKDLNNWVKWWYYFVRHSLPETQ